jgi:hypothetical protein
VGVYNDTWNLGLVDWYERERKKRQVDACEWLLTLGGQAYLVRKAREEGWSSRSISQAKGGGLVLVIFEKDVEDEGGSAELRIGKADTESKATAYAVGKALGVELPEGVE